MIETLPSLVVFGRDSDGKPRGRQQGRTPYQHARRPQILLRER